MEGRYATALFSAASKQNKLDQVEQELGKLSVSKIKKTLNCSLFINVSCFSRHLFVCDVDTIVSDQVPKYSV